MYFAVFQRTVHHLNDTYVHGWRGSFTRGMHLQYFFVSDPECNQVEKYQKVFVLVLSDEVVSRPRAQRVLVVDFLAS